MGTCVSASQGLAPPSSSSREMRFYWLQSWRRNSESSPWPALQVLVNVDLFRTITSFMPGVARMIRAIHSRAMRQTGPYARAQFIVSSLPRSNIGRLYIAKQLHQAYPLAFTKSVMDLVAKAGYLDVLEFMHQECRRGCSKNAMDLAAAHGHLEIVEFLHEHRTEGCSTDAMDRAAAGGYLEIVRFLHTHRTEGCTLNALNLAAVHGHLQVVQYLTRHCDLQQSGIWPSGYHHEWLAFKRICRTSESQTALMEEEEPRLESPMDYAVLKDEDESRLLSPIDWATLHGHLPVVEYLFREGILASCRVSVAIITVATERGHTDTVRYLVANDLVHI
ncbi:hypothetical protein LEN26_001112 [Aphanomyces euteiches]|nr:hypothetical protein LEN26_001112 [Aphanomyces euteiches]